MRNTVLTILLAGFYVFKLSSQDLIPPIQNFSSVQYGAASQNWDIAIDSLGIIYAANNEGLLSYDGMQWKLSTLESGSIIRSVYPQKDRVYTGSYQEFGYWQRDKTGAMQYTSLSPLIKERQMRNEEIWDIISFNGDIYFRSFAAIYKYDHNTIEVVQNRVSNAMLAYNGELFVAAGQLGLCRLTGEKDLQALPSQEIIGGNTIVDMLDFKGALLVGTRNALYTYRNGRFSLFEDRELINMLERYEFNHISKVSEDEFVIATVKNGIIHYNNNTRTSRIYNRNSGLQNNTVLAMALRNGKLWLGLDNGIDAISLDSPISFYTDDTGELGAVYDLAYHNSTLYLASNTGVYLFQDGELRIVEGAEGHTWNLEVLGKELYANHNTGTYRVEGNRFLPVEERTGSFEIQSMPGEFTGRYIIGSYTGISVYDPDTRDVSEIEGVTFPVKKMILETNGTIWASHPYEGVYRIGMKNGIKDRALVEKMGDTSNERFFKADVFKLNNQIGILQNNEWYKYNSFLDSLVPFPELSNFKNHRLLLEDRNGYWFTNTENNSIVFTDFKEVQINLAFQELNNRLVKGNENLIKINDSLYLVTLNDGFGKINLPELLRSKANERISDPIIMGLSDMIVNHDITRRPSIPFRQGREISFRTGLPDSDATDLFYELEGAGNMKGRVENGQVTFQNLSNGDYRIKIFSMSPQGNMSNITHFDFVILPPWYLSNLMKLGYVLLFLTLIGMIYWLNRLKLKKHRLILEQKFKKEHEERLNKLEKERLLNEINSKRKELANTTLISAKKNEVLMEIQGELSKDKEKFSNQFRLKHLMNKINNAIKSKDEWKVYETNFNELHEDFFKELLQAYPKLSNKDLKLCSYLKMNMSSKEIAPLMGISVRGVEVHRYRLRKKMGLDSKENLTNFMIRNF
ncbi:histidine kinase [Antarcticibacterium flavum]|uniref:Histidine kinase n=1 Tax=Antarcticibacterium flavum TaxID=2058175 RepID=A0A5B7X0V3_9FLAO|nr:MULTISPECIES: LuxR C-terminal-related transcriptional regulator [Antarcticibacterium]MCM4159880.1 histidine kinase [Antarcticibacterium sp. W02-3]QCY68880.1 histidine kinase [Antarcticibacterium flavum]